jgi:hypothetical protein
VSVNGAEEDGVDNRVEAPDWAPDGGSDSAAEGRQPEKSAPQPKDTQAAEPRPDADAGSGPETSSWPDTSSWAPPVNGAAAPSADPVNRANGAGPSFAQPGTQTGPGPNTAQLPAAGVGGAAAGGAAAGGAAAGGTAVGGAAAASAMGAARGLAAKVSAPFSSLTKPRPSGKTAQPRYPGSAAAQKPRPPVRPQPRLTPGIPTGPQTRRAQLRLDRVEPWSVMKFSFLMSLLGWVVLFVAVSVLYFALSKLGVFTSIEHTVGLVTSNKSNPQGSNAASWFRASRVLGYTMLVGAVNVILLTALATIGAVVYNLVTMLTGGIEITLKESD